MSDNTTETLVPAALDWSDGLPVSRQFEDIYYSRDDGLRESGHVFVAGNRLAERWGRLAPGSVFTIAETGFGTGLNFLCALNTWLECAPTDARLHFLSMEKYPLEAAHLRRALSRWPGLADLAEALADVYPPLLPGFHRRWLCQGRVCLTLIFDDALRGLEQLRATEHPALQEWRHFAVDAWFLDGFAPARNPELWSPSLFHQMAALSRPGTSLATFTVARLVRDGLADAGFATEREPGYGHKRHMLTGSWTAPETTAAPEPARKGRKRSTEAPWHLCAPTETQHRDALIVGGGIAGCSTAAALRRRGWRVRILERHGQLAPEASGNPQGILYPRLSVDDSPLAVFARHALSHALDLYGRFWRNGGEGEPCGVLVLPENDKQRRQFPPLAERYRSAPDFVTLLEGTMLRERAGVPLEADSGLFFPGLGWISPPALCHWLAGDIERIQGAAAGLIAEDGLWTVQDGTGTALAAAPVLILCAGRGSSAFAETAHLPLRVIRGQISQIPATSASSRLASVICGRGYLAPAHRGEHTLGATYDLDDPDTGLRPADHRRNLAGLAGTDPALEKLLAADTLAPEQLAGRAALRCTTPDYLPLVGPVPDPAAMAEKFADLRRDARADIPEPGCYHEGLWVNGGHGSRGFTYAPLAAELLASQLTGEPPPLPRDLMVALHPARFLIRDLKRNRR